MKFRSDSPKLKIYAPRIGKTIVFSRGVYKTEDRAEIAVLNSHPSVQQVSEKAD